MLLETNSFEFEEFRLDASEKVLSRHGKPISITPKAFQLLLELVRNHGRPVKKSDLMKTVWADSFVEDGNLTFTINILRKVLGDEKQNLRFIETIPKHGYRFIAEVKEISAPFVSHSAPAPNPKAEPYFAKYGAFLIPTLAVILMATLGLGFWYRQGNKEESVAPILSQPFALENISINGKVMYAVLSSDGKNIVYTNQVNGRQSIWLRQLESGNNVEIVPASDDVYFGLALAHDGNSLYFNRHPQKVAGQGDVYRVSIFGGVTAKIISEAQGWISLSPNGKQISFVRCFYRREENCSIWIADAQDGKNERKLASRPQPLRIGSHRISPDGKKVAFAAGQSENHANEFGLYEVDLENGSERDLTREKFFNVKDLVWLPEEMGWLITARRNSERNFRIWKLSANGEASPLTRDAETYSVLSLSRDATRLVSTQIKREVSTVVFQIDNPSEKEILTGATSGSFAPDGNIVFSSEMSGNSDIWQAKPDGSEQRQLTNNVSDEFAPIVSPDNTQVLYSSNRTGEAQLWQMNKDGTDQRQITQKEGGFPIFVSPDGEWVYYRHSLQSTLWRVSLKTKEEQLVLDQAKTYFAFSPDGLQIAFVDTGGRDKVLTIYSQIEKKYVKTLPLPSSQTNAWQLKWMPDGKKLAYISNDDKYENNTLWLQPLVGGNPQRIADLGTDGVSGMFISPDGKTIAIGQGKWIHDAVLLKGLK